VLREGQESLRAATPFSFSSSAGVRAPARRSAASPIAQRVVRTATDCCKHAVVFCHEGPSRGAADLWLSAVLSVTFARTRPAIWWPKTNRGPSVA